MRDALFGLAYIFGLGFIALVITKFLLKFTWFDDFHERHGDLYWLLIFIYLIATVIPFYNYYSG